MEMDCNPKILARFFQVLLRPAHLKYITCNANKITLAGHNRLHNCKLEKSEVNVLHDHDVTARTYSVFS